MIDKTLGLNKPWSNEADLNLGATGDTTLDVPKWSNDANLNLQFVWTNEPSLEFVRVLPIPPTNVWSNSADLSIAKEWSAGANLDVSPIDEKDKPTATVIDGVANSSTLAPISTATGVYIAEGLANSESLAPMSTAESEQDINVWRGVGLTTQVATVQSDKLHVAKGSVFSDSPQLQQQNSQAVFDAESLQNNVSQSVDDLPRVSSIKTVELVDGDSVQSSVTHVINRMIDIKHSVSPLFESGEYLTENVASDFLYPPRSDCAKSQQWQDAEQLEKQWLDGFDHGSLVKQQWLDSFENAIKPTGNRHVLPIEPPKPLPDRLADLNLNVLWSKEADLEFVRIELDALIIMNTVIMYHTSKGGVKTYINPVSWSIVSDLDSYSWSLNCSLYDENILSLLATDDLFTLSVNGIEWGFNSFKYKRLSDGQFSGYNVTFVSQVQKLGYPIAQPMNISLDAPKGALQLVEEVLGDVPLINKGVSEWTLRADTVDFMQAEPKAIVSEILKATGAVMLPSVTGDKIIIQPRYKVASWLMNELTDLECDVLLDGNYMITDSGEIRNGTEFNAVTINGEKSGTVTRVVLDGTAGDVEATDYTTQIHQDHNVGLEYAKKIFSENGTIELAEISVGLDDNLLQSGSIVRIKHVEGDRTGVSLGVTVKGDRVENVLQTATIEFRL